MELTIDGKTIETGEKMTVLEAAREKAIYIPTLCHHPALEPFGSCRLCTVEIEKNSRVEMHAACTYPAEDGLSVSTDSPRVRTVRKMVLSYLRARCPDVPLLEDLADRLGIETLPLPFSQNGEEKCILCGRCVRVCREVIGKKAISFAFRGAARRPSSPYDCRAEDCIGCTACEYICPTGAVHLKRTEQTLSLFPWNTDLTLQTCPGCNELLLTEKALQHLAGKLQKADQAALLCEKCRRKETARQLEIIPAPRIRGIRKS